KRLIQNLGRNIADDVAKYKESFAKLIQRFNDHTVVVTNIVTLRVMESVGRFDQSLTLSSLLVAPGSGFQPEKGCLPGTRTPLIDLIMKWVYSVDEEDTKPVFWLHGPAGSGKSAISHAVAERCRADGRLGRIFCFSTSARDRKLEQMFPTIAVGLADLDPDWRKTLCETIQRDHEHDLNTTYSLQLQFENFLLEPAKGLEERAVGPIVVIIDALDECGGISQRAQLLKYISRFAELPSNFRFLFTSRSDRDMMDVLSKLPCVRSQDIADPEYDTADADIGLFVNESLSTYSMITEDPRWVSSRVVDTLVGAAEKSFQWASTACAFIRGEGDYQEYDWHERFEAVVGSVSASQQSDVQYHNLDSLYHLVLSRLFKSGPSIRFKRILGRVLAVREPLSIEALKGLHGEDEGPEWTKNLLSLMGSLLYGVSQAETPIRPLHGSFREFLTDGTRSGPYCVDLDDADDKLVHSTLRIMKSSLRFNICHLESSYKLNTEYDDLDQRIRTYMTPGLIYSIRYWAQHVGQERAASDPNLLWNIENFFANHALSWLESLSLLRSLLSCASTLSALKRFASVPSRLLRWVDDMDRFIHLYGAVISSSAPHIYVSALPFSPTTSLIAQYYAERFSQSAKVFRGRATHWPALRSVMRGHSELVVSVAFSRDGKRIVSASYDHLIRVWDAATGEAVGKPLEGHTADVNSVMFSFDGRRILSCSDDETIRLWDAESGEALGGPLTGHGRKVNSVAFSPDDNYIVSGGNDGTIRVVWDAGTGQTIQGPFRGHTDAVFSVSVSSDGKRIVSGSLDDTIRIWDADSEDLIGQPIRCRSTAVASVAFSPDGTYIVSGSADKTVRVWYADSGESVRESIEGHSGGVSSIDFSPDGAIAKLTWDDQNITAVAFSPDGKRIASGSFDKMIRIWDTEQRIAIRGPLRAHSDIVRSVAFAPDGVHVISGSDDGT
ncbi:tricorn protease domain 2-containing protein, partial [Punctularia strigosozonata HHB-11173 SS5]|uniref:tricorn protease domain 2-containing protein n=1 Tax=Punctularia strigosozonata (strain HHB-11173) TaxID=741275 RepID=UPI0004416E81